MQSTNRAGISFLGVVAAMVTLWCWPPLVGAAPETSDATPASGVTGAWQHHKATFNYLGFTTSYTCDGLEGHVRQILLLLGARPDLKVIASGCPGPYNAPSHAIWVDVDFYALAPAADSAESGTVKAHWSPLEMTPKRPAFMGDGDCELVAGMKDLITKNFSLRDIEYRTECVPHEIVLNGFAVKGQTLRAVPAVTGAAKG